jgi:hypothetical protein
MYHKIKRLLTTYVLNLQKRLIEFNLIMNSRKFTKDQCRKINAPKLKSNQIKAAKAYYKARGYNLKNTYWHRYNTAVNGIFREDYVPMEIFWPIINPRLNKKRQWPALLDKNLTYNLFKEFEQPKRVVQNINGFYFINDVIVTEDIAIEACNVKNKSFVIKPSIESGGGRMVEIFTVKDNINSINDLAIIELFRLYNKDFIVQENVKQNEFLKSLNPSSLNTLRIVSYLREDGVHLLSTALRIGNHESKTDNFSGGGIFWGIDEFGVLKSKGYSKKEQFTGKTASGVIVAGRNLPNYDAVVKMVKQMHIKIPYFQIVSWDIGINNKNMPVFIEYNTYNQGMEIQVANGPLFGKFADEILALGLKPY